MTTESLPITVVITDKYVKKARYFGMHYNMSLLHYSGTKHFISLHRQNIGT